MNKLFLFFLFTLFSSISFAQQKLNIFVDAGVSKLKNSWLEESNYKIIYQPSFSLGVSYQYYLHKNIYIKTGLVYMQINSKDSNNLQILTNHEADERYANSEYSQFVSYASLPLGIGIDFHSLSFEVVFLYHMLLDVKKNIY